MMAILISFSVKEHKKGAVGRGPQSAGVFVIDTGRRWASRFEYL